MIPEQELHDAFEPQGGEWRELLALTVERAIIVRATSDMIARHKRSVLTHG